MRRRLRRDVWIAIAVVIAALAFQFGIRWF